MISLALMAFLLPFVTPGVYAAKKPQGNNVCTRVRTATEITRVPLTGTKTQTIRYTTICGLQGRCSKYRTVYVRNYREVSRTVYRVMQECCAGWIQEGTRCVLPSSALPDTAAAGGLTTSVPRGTASGGTKFNGGVVTSNDGQPNHPVSWPGVTTGHGDLPGTDGSTDGRTWGGKTGGERRVNIDGTTAGGNRGAGRRGDQGGGRGSRPGTDGTSKTRNVDDAIHGGTKDGNGYGGAVPDKQPPHQRDSPMMFLTGMLCGVAVLSLGAFVVIFLMYRQRRHIDNRIIGIPLFQSTRSGSSSIRKSKLLAFAQSINSRQMKLLREPTKKGKGRGNCPYTDIEELIQKGITFNNSTESLPALSSQSAKEKSMSLKMPKMLTLKPSTSSWKQDKNERKLPPKPPTYAIIQRPDSNRTSTGGDEERPPSVVHQRVESTLYATPDVGGVPNGNSHTIPRDFNMGPPRYILCESQHIYTDIQRKSKAMTWSCSKRLRSKSSGSTYDSPKRERTRKALSRTLSRSSLKSSAKRASNSGSSGYSSLRGSRENIYDNCTDSGAESSATISSAYSNIYSETIPKDRTSAHYGKLDLALSDTFKTEYDKLNRGPTTRGLVKSFSKKYEKLAMSKTGKGPNTETT
ncbi:uncharacterized protein [Asterias amurensis]|uniref:uncharacterized protein n=1 Tax=Asterias amurensis TaxID=7602 RepID=UPI003AB457A8